MKAVRGAWLALLVLTPTAAEAPKRTIRIIGREDATVTTAQVRLGDIADVSSPYGGDDDAVIALQKIVITDSPRPGESLTLSAAQVLDRLRAQGVSLQHVGYALRRIVTVNRAGRPLAPSEVRAAIEEYLRQSNSDVTLKEVTYRPIVKLVPGMTTLQVTPYAAGAVGQMHFEIAAEVEGEAPVRFKVRAAVDEWREVPVAARSLERGSVIAAEDIRMARMNASTLGSDVSTEKDALVGLAAESTIASGEVFRRTKLAIPPVIAAGAGVTLVYKRGALTATATGVALEAGRQGEQIKVRNSGSKKIVAGTVIEPGLVGVN